jgi:hypothetical protein
MRSPIPVTSVIKHIDQQATSNGTKSGLMKESSEFVILLLRTHVMCVTKSFMTKMILQGIKEHTQMKSLISALSV